MLDELIQAQADTYMDNRLHAGPHQDTQTEPDPLLPLDLPGEDDTPSGQRKRGLRLVC